MRSQGWMNVASADDPMKAWLDMVEQFQKVGLGSTTPEFLRTMFAPMQQQLDLLEKAYETQAEFNRKLTEQAFVPIRQVLEGLQQAAKTTRAAGEALKEAGELLTQQATAMDQALSFSSPIPRHDRSPRRRIGENRVAVGTQAERVMRSQSSLRSRSATRP
jgi:hypothetical protein